MRRPGGRQALKDAEGLQAFLAAAEDALTSLRETAPALATTDAAIDPTAAADRRRKHEEAVAELAAIAPKIKKVNSSGKALISAGVRHCASSWFRSGARGPPARRTTDPSLSTSFRHAVGDVRAHLPEQHPEKATVEAKLAELDAVWTELNNQAKVCRATGRSAPDVALHR